MRMTNITYHPSDELLRSHANGELPESLSVAVSLHCELCSECKNKVEAISQELAKMTWQSNSQTMCTESNEPTVDYTTMLESIMQLDTDDSYLMSTPTYHVSIADKTFEVPYLLHRYDDLKWNQLGAVSRARLIEEQDTRSNLLHIAAGGEIPNHTHKGFELTLLLDGSFQDESGHYQKGDFIWLDASHEHSPKTTEGCLCYTVQNAPLHFTKGLSKLFNPIGGLLY